MIHSHIKELKNIQVKYEFPICVGDTVPVLLTALASAPTTSPVRFAILLGHRNCSCCREQLSLAAPIAAYLPWPQTAGKNMGSLQRWEGRGLRGLGLHSHPYSSQQESATRIAWANPKTPACPQASHGTLDWAVAAAVVL